MVRLLDAPVSNLLSPFHSPLLKRLVRLRRGFTLDITGIADNDAQFAGAVLAKIAQRGFPAPCSAALERFLLRQAQKVGLLRWRELTEAGALIFQAQPNRQDLTALLKACYFAELLLGDEEAEALLDCYRSLCTPPEQEFYDLFYETCPDPRLALFLIPQRLMVTMVRLTRPTEELGTLVADRRVDFAVEIPALNGSDWFRLVVEIDDPSHTNAQKVLDAKRDHTLRSNGWEVWRLSAKMRSGWKEQVRELVKRLRNAITDEIIHAAKVVRTLPKEQQQALMELILLPVAEAQLTVAVARWLHANGTAEIRIANPQKWNLQIVLNGVDECLTHLEALYGLRHFGRPLLVDSESDANAVYFALSSAQAWEQLALETLTVLTPTVAFSDFEDALLEGALPRPVSEEMAKNERALESTLTYFLHQLFRKEGFWEGQVKIISRALQHKPVVGLLPTAGGKSLCYQMASLLQPGFTIVAQPLRSLMWDQQDNLDAIGIHRSTAIMSHAEITPDEEARLKEEGYRAIEKGLRFFVFISPERFQIPEFRQQVKTFIGSYPIPHCVSEWGHDFRPAYLNLGWLVPQLCEHRGYSPTFIALTGTASQNVLTDILRELGILDPEATVMPENFDRSELDFNVIKVRSEERFDVLKSLFKNLVGYRPGQPMTNLPSGLIFTYFVNDRQIGAAHLRNELKNAFPELSDAIDVYSGEKPYWWFKRSDRDWELWKIKLQQRFKRNEVPIFVCTHSFGMGIDKPDIRFTVHVMLPRSLEEFYQQAGRAGRDRKSSHCYIIFSDDQPELADEVLDPVRVPIERTSELVQEIPRKQQSDALRNTWFLRNSFLGKDSDKRIVGYVWQHLTLNLPTRERDRRQVELPFDFLPNDLVGGEGDLSERKQQALEKAIYRLLAVGAVDDYMKDYTGSKFIISLIRRPIKKLDERFKEYLSRYATEGEIRRYLPERKPHNYSEAVLIYAHQVVEFVYDRIERRRRRAMWEMLQAARDATRLGIQKFREQLNNYMAESEFTQPVKELTKRILPVEWFDLLRKAEGVDGLVKLFGACRRQLEEFPEHPGLLLLTGFCRLHYGDEGLRDIGDAFLILRRDYPKVNCYEVAQRLIAVTKERFPTKLDKAVEAILNSDSSREMARLCYAEAPPYGSAYTKALFILVSGVLKILGKDGERNE
jgi:superfamily II DNA helicase RecQ